MGRVIVEQIVSADGIAEARDGGIDFFEDNPDLIASEPDQLELLKTVDAIVLGANTYRLFAKYWPKSDEAIAEPINRLPKHVFASTLDDAKWGKHEPAIIERDSVQRTIVQLRERYAGNLIVWGSLRLCETLFDDDLVDVLRLRIVPVLVGAGRGVTPPKMKQLKLKLSGSQGYPGGAVTLTYALR